MLNVHYKSLNKKLITENEMTLEIRFLCEHIINTGILREHQIFFKTEVRSQFTIQMQ